MQSAHTTHSYVFKLVPVLQPHLIGPRGGRHYLANTPSLVPGRDHVVIRRLRSAPRPLFAAKPPIDWRPASDELRSPLWGDAADPIRKAVDNLLRTTARKLNISIIDDIVVSRTARVAKGPPLSLFQVSEINFIANQIVAAARHYNEWSLAWADDLTVPRAPGERITVAWQAYDAHTTKRLRSLLRAAERGTQARLELQWHQAPSATRYFIWRAAVAWPSADRHAVFAQAAVPGKMISAPIPSREFLRAVLPEAIKMSARQRGRRVVASDVFLGVVREMFLMLVGDGNDRLRVERLEVPNGVGADFVREIEAIFGIRLLDEASLHAVNRVRSLKLPATTALRPYVRSFTRFA